MTEHLEVVLTQILCRNRRLFQYKIHYSPDGRVEYLRDKFIDDGGTESTDDHTTLNGAITIASNTITVTDAIKVTQSKQMASEVDDTVTNKWCNMDWFLKELSIVK